MVSLNRYEEPARVLFVFPSHQVEQVARQAYLERRRVFPSERGVVRLRVAAGPATGKAKLTRAVAGGNR